MSGCLDTHQLRAGRKCGVQEKHPGTLSVTGPPAATCMTETVPTEPTDASKEGGFRPLGCVVCKMDVHREQAMRGYVAMLVVDKAYRGSELVKRSIQSMIEGGCEEVVLEAEVSNTGALRLYEGLGFLREKRLHRYYLNGQDAYRLKLLLPLTPEQEAAVAAKMKMDVVDPSLNQLGSAMLKVGGQGSGWGDECSDEAGRKAGWRGMRNCKGQWECMYFMPTLRISPRSQAIV
ncbi:N-acetyltransferase domain-containing protein [Haematococcus lacustris]|uniref:N-acetyltransferase domain-containing protein n=1 Tax=Haematococcus lacustris TaxID=44745 RepID=A0A699Y944_HAELA|nr:N-acetyltransferase domain-containing protein [Haematococcus lacustris]